MKKIKMMMRMKTRMKWRIKMRMKMKKKKKFLRLPRSQNMGVVITK